jgi:predicted DNA-binding transcriptional regulator AlpA
MPPATAPKLAGLHEIAELAGVSRQRAFQITGNKGFPKPIAELQMGRVWDRGAVERYLAGRPGGPERPAKG